MQTSVVSPDIYTLRPEQFGAVGDGKADDSDAIQAALNFCLDHKDYSRGGEVLLSAGRMYRCKKPLIITDANAAQAVGITLRGEARGPYVVGNVARLGFDTKDQPGLIIQHGRNIHIEDLLFIGSGKDGRLSRYTPHAGISIDSFCPATPESYPGLESLCKASSGSKQVYIERCAMQGWAVGIMHNSSATNPQGDGLSVRDCYIQKCQVAFGTGNTQSRATMLDNLEIWDCDTYVDNCSFGQMRGTPPHVRGGQANRIGKLFNIQPNVDVFHVQDLYGEELDSIGSFGQYVHPDNHPVKFTGSMFSFDKHTQPTLTTCTNVAFDSCHFDSYRQSFDFLFGHHTDHNSDSPTITFDNCGFRSENPLGDSPIYSNAWSRVVFRNCATKDPQYYAVSVMARHPLTDRTMLTSLTAINGKLVTSGQLIQTQQGTFTAPLGETVIPLGNVPIEFDGVGGAMFRAPSGMVRKGDLVRGTAIQKINGSDCKLSMTGIAGIVDGDSVHLLEVPTHLTPGSHVGDLELVCKRRFHFPTTGSTKAGSTKIESVKVEGSRTQHTWLPGHRLFGDGIAEGAYVVTVADDVIEMSMPAKQSGKRELYDARI